MGEYVQVAVSSATFHFDKLYTYRVPGRLEGAVQIGSMVLVPFGRGKTARMGVVLGAQPPEEQAPHVIKELYDVAPERARLSPELLELVHFLKEYTFCTYYEAVKAIIPYGAQYTAASGDGVPHLRRQMAARTESVYCRTDAPWTGRRTEKQQAAWDALAEGGKTRGQLAAAGVTKAVLDALIKKGVIVRTDRECEAKAMPGTQETPAAQSVTLSPAQQRAFDQLAALMDAGKPAAALLYGVTSSGKTLVFLKLIEKTLAAGRTALVLVPEIALTPQMIARMKAHFGARVAVQHSALSHGERLAQWQQIQNGGAQIVVGTRSAVFAPLSNIGLIVIDEEQEHTYHSESAPRYSAHDVARRRAATHGALLLLASATPSTESYHAAKTGRYTLVEIHERYNQMPLPEVRVVDMREELSAGNASSISRALAQEMGGNLARGEQTILLLNRRGYQTVGMCTACHTVLKCGACSVPMVYHKAEDKLLCHYCGKSFHPVPTECPACGGRIKYTGFGTQRVEEELAAMFPKARVLRMDLDTTGRRNAHETMLRRFAQGEYDIMLGTQMVAKGLDFERVSLVGVLGVDQLLFAQGYKAYEKVFSLVTQVVGRGGRAAYAGRALIQTVDPMHPILALAARQDYAAFYEQEIAFRKINLYPPFCAICLVGFQGEKEPEVMAAAQAFAQAVRGLMQGRTDIPLRMLGPAPMHIAQINGLYRCRLTLKCRNDRAFRTLAGEALAAYNAGGWPGKASVYLDFHSDADL